MLDNAQRYCSDAPWIALIPGVLITLTVARFNVPGEELRKACDSQANRG